MSSCERRVQYLEECLSGPLRMEWHTIELGTLVVLVSDRLRLPVREIRNGDPLVRDA